jgi:hypothetical protein
VQEGGEGLTTKIMEGRACVFIVRACSIWVGFGEGAVAQEKGRSSWTTPIAGKVWGKVLDLRVLMTLHWLSEHSIGSKSVLTALSTNLSPVSSEMGELK